MLNKVRYANARILLTRENFGCGSSREHAPWALDDYGFRVILAPSFADIFFNNCFKNGLLPIVLDSKIIDSLFAEVEAIPGFELSVDLEEQVIRMPDGGSIIFEIEASRKHCLLNGLDDIGITLGDAELIRQFEDGWRATSPFYFTLK